MSQFTSLAELYDRLTSNVPYGKYAAQIERLFRLYKCTPSLVLDLACGTGTLTALLAEQGYEMIGVDLSPEMLMQAREKCADLSVPPVFLCQDMCALDLYGTIQAAICCLDSVNYLTDRRRLSRAFSRVSLFLEPGGLFLFDVKTPQMFEEMAGQVSVDEDEDFFGVWQYGFNAKTGLAEHFVDLFLQQDEHYIRCSEEHRQRAWSLDIIKDELRQAGFEIAGVFDGLTSKKAKNETGRLFIAARKSEE